MTGIGTRRAEAQGARREPRLREPEVFANTGPNALEARRLANSLGAEETRRNSITVEMRLARSCAGWEKRPTSAEFYDAIRAPIPDGRQRAVLRVFSQEADWRELVSAWAEQAYTLRELVQALHRAGQQRCRAARYLNGWATRPPGEGT